MGNVGAGITGLKINFQGFYVLHKYDKMSVLD